MDQKVSLEWWFFLTIAALLGIFFLLNKKFDLTGTWIKTIEKFAPYWLTFFPAFITYFCVCGALSAITVYVYTEVVGGKNNIERDSFLFSENCVEFTCSLVMPCIYFVILKKRNFHWLWIVIITVVHVLAAGYRDAKLIQLTNDQDGKTFESGPIILNHFEYLDGLMPVISLLIFLIFFNKKQSEQLEPEV